MIEREKAPVWFVLFILFVPTFVSAQYYSSRPTIISRASWGADDSYLFTTRTQARNTRRRLDDHPITTKRQTDCDYAQERYPEEFTVEQTVSSYEGRKLRWSRRYSPKVHQLVVHHTALQAQNDSRTDLEKVQALYEFHANQLGWGDVGYHYIIDESGKVYEGRSGGDYVVGGHAYCHNVGTIGVVMLGHFDIEKPTNAQMVSLKWLLDHLADKYNIDPGGYVRRRGQRMPTIVGHGDLMSTQCPGYYVNATIDQIRTQVAMKDYSGRIIFPTLALRKYTDRSESRLQSRLQSRGLTLKSIELQAVGKTEHTSRPGGTVQVMMQFNARRSYNGLERIATVDRSNSGIGIWQEAGNKSARIRNELIIPEKLQPGESLQIPLRFQMPRQPGTYSVDIGEVTYTFTSEGRRVPQPKTEPTRQTFQTEDRTNVQTVGYRRARAESLLGRTASRIRRRLGNVSNTSSSDNKIRIRLTASGHDFRLETASNVYHLTRNGNECELREADVTIDRGNVRVGSLTSGITTIANWPNSFNQFRGVIECRIIDSQMVLINELTLGDYMKGLGEEPDSQPYEKQRAIAIAARSYATFYIDAVGDARKFRGKPYDGSDSPASFQLYKGYVFERNNPSWVRAVQSTANQILKKNGSIVKAAYYSSNDGRTRSPAENGWKNFPHEEIFASKYDPWCKGMQLRGHGVGMSGCGSFGQAKEGKLAEEILSYYYPGTEINEY